MSSETKTQEKQKADPFVSDVSSEDSERIDIESDKYTKETKQRHVARYEWAAGELKKRFVRAGRVIDFACGTGYGSAILATAAHEVYGRDKDPFAIATAKIRYGSTLVNFAAKDKIQRHACVCNETQSGLTSNGMQVFGIGHKCKCAASVDFDAVVSIETIEHLEEPFGPEQFLEECRKLIIPHGLMVLSTPLKNPNGLLRSKYHIREYSVDEINKLVERFGFGAIKHYDVLPAFICLTAVRLP